TGRIDQARDTGRGDGVGREAEHTDAEASALDARSSSQAEDGYAVADQVARRVRVLAQDGGPGVVARLHTEDRVRPFLRGVTIDRGEGGAIAGRFTVDANPPRGGPFDTDPAAGLPCDGEAGCHVAVVRDLETAVCRRARAAGVWQRDGLCRADAGQ